MTSAPVLRSSALQKALALTPARPPVQSAAPTFAATLSSAQARFGAAASRAIASAPARPLSAPGAAAAATDVSGPIPFQNEIVAAATKYGVDPALLAGLLKQESNFNPKAQSGVGARGLTQLMDATARGLGISDSFDPAQSLDAGAKFLGGLLKQFHGDERLALAAYNAGPGAVQKFGGIPPYEETQATYRKYWGMQPSFAASVPSPTTWRTWTLPVSKPPG